MERGNNDKENSRIALKNGTITSCFKVKKCLFDQTVSKTSELTLKAESSLLLSSPLKNATEAPFEDSPFALFKIRKKRGICKHVTDKSSNGGPIVTTPTQKRGINGELHEQEKRNRASSPLAQSPTVVKLAVQKSILNPDLIGDFSMPCTLSTVKGRHPDLKSISPETVADILNSPEKSGFTLIDCRYPYEYEGGHIKTAVNIFNKDDVEKEFFPKPMEKNVRRNVLIFYCEFSSERGPSMLRCLRSLDRDLNKSAYPFLYYPELYLIEGGYKAFFFNFKDLCEPQEYKMMLDQNFANDLAYYRTKCKSWNHRSKRLKKARSSLVF
ncbi:M-phase inducer phosphatase-like [Uloborus diversus]|uniref:M-phase inducer phosphatase-like n=1 Tax=Uloborus diversus TaxID=327109 RepID=UPI00240A987A|nr:M-phase inducer phosphatase-like [Uloborus diversus]